MKTYPYIRALVSMLFLAIFVWTLVNASIIASVGWFFAVLYSCDKMEQAMEKWHATKETKTP